MISAFPASAYPQITEWLSPLESYVQAGLASREPNVININVQGEFLSTGGWAVLDRIGTETVIPNNTLGVDNFDLHSQALLTAYLQSIQTAGPNQTLNDVTFKLPDLLSMIFDPKLFAYTTAKSNTTDENFLEHLVRHEAGVGGMFAADGMVTRFTADLWKIAQDGGLTMTNSDISKTLIAFAMQMYYENPNATASDKHLFSDVSGGGGIHFDRSDVAATLSAAKGYTLYFMNYLNTLPIAERMAITQNLPNLMDWYIQAGSTMMYATAGDQRAFMLGGDGGDSLFGSNLADVLVGNEGDDTLSGREGDDVIIGGVGNDTLYGGDGYDTYIINGHDTIFDSDGKGVIKDNAGRVIGGAIQKDANGNYVFVTDTTISVALDTNLILTLAGGASVVINNFKDGDLGLHLIDSVSQTASETTRTIVGDYEWKDFDPDTDGIQEHYDNLGNAIRDFDQPKVMDDELKGSVGNDLILSGAGDDLVYAKAGDDQIDAGAGRDIVDGGAGNDVIQGGADGDILIGRDGNDRLYGDSEISVEQAIANGSRGIGTGYQGDWLAGGAGDDILIGSSGNDVLSGGGGSDLLIAGAGDDDILGDNDWIAQSLDWTVTDEPQVRLFQPVTGVGIPSDGAADIIYAGSGNDHAWGGLGDDVIYGEDGNDSLSGNDGNDIVMGGMGNDTIRGDGRAYSGQAYVDEGDDLLDGGDGNDTILGNGKNDALYGGDGDDQMYGDDEVTSGELHGNDYLDGGAGNDNLWGNGGDDMLYGGDGDDFISGDGGNVSGQYHGIDMLYGGAGNDALRGNGNSDYLYGGNGDDQLQGDDEVTSGELHGNDFLDGGAGNDNLWGNGGDDILYGGDGNDSLDGDDGVISGQYHGVDMLFGGAGNDVMWGGGNADTLYGGEGDDHLEGDYSTTVLADEFHGDDYLDGGDGNDVLIGGGRSDTLYGGNGNDLLIGDTAGISAALQGNDYLDGGAGNDTLYGDGGADVLIGGDGNDELYGESSDTPVNAQGDDFLDGGLGDDLLNGGGGNDTLLGGDGADRLYGDADSTPASAVGNDYLDGGAGDDILVGDGGADTLIGGDGNDEMDGDAAGLENSLHGNDYLDGGSGNDSLIGGGGADTLYGGDGDDLLQGDGLGVSIAINGNDYLDGGAGSDTLYGDGGNDYLIGGTGNDWLEGGEGDDSYAFGVGDGQDRVADSSGRQSLIFSSGITSADIAVSISNGMVYLKYGVTDHLVMDADSFSNIQMAKFSDGSTLTGNQLQDKFIPGSSTVRILSLGAGITSSEIAYFGVNENLIIAYNGSLDNWINTIGLNAAGVLFQVGDGIDYGLSVSKLVLVLNNWYQSNPVDYINQIQTSTGNVSLTSSAPVGRTFIGTAGNDVISATIGNDVITGGAGSDLLLGGEGDDIYKFSLGDGEDSIIDNSGLLDKLQFGPGISRADLTVTLTVDGLGVIVGPEVNGDSILIRGWVNSDSNYIDSFSFDDGSSLSATEIEGLITGNHRPSVVTPLPDHEVDLGKSFSISFAGSFSDYDLGDVLTYSVSLSDGGQLPSWININPITQTLSGIAPGIERAGPIDVVVTATDQNGLYRSDTFMLMVGLNSIIGTASRDILSGDSANNTIIGYAGDDSLNGGLGDDFLNGGDGNDTLDGGAGNDVLYGGKGNDNLTDSEGDNIYLINAGDGKDTIFNGSTGTHVVKFGNEITLDDVKAHFIQKGSTLSVIVNYAKENPNDYLIFDSNFSSPYFNYIPGYGMVQAAGISNSSHYTFTLSDGSSIGLNDLIEQASIGTDGNDLLTPNSQNEAVFGGDGNDVIFGKYTYAGGSYNNNILYGEGGDDVITAGAGNDIIYGGIGADELLGEDGDDTLYGDDVAYGGDGNDLIYGGSGNDILYGGNKNDQLFGGDGNDFLSGGDQDDIVNGGDGDDIISAGSSYTIGDVVRGGKGNDQFIASTGKTHYLFDSGDGQDIISDIGNSTLKDRFEFLQSSGVQLKDLIVTQLGNDIVIDSGVGDMITIKDWYLSADNKIEEFVTYSKYGNTIVSTAAYIESMTYSSNHTPVVVSPILDAAASEGAVFTYVVPAGSFSDSDVGDVLGYAATLADGSTLPGWLTFNAATQTFSGTPGFQDVGVVSLKVIAYDQSGEEASDVFTLTVNTSRNVISGTSGNDSLTGTSAADLIYGFGGNDILDGAAGADALVGGLGDDTYVVDNVSDFVIENVNEGTDLVKSSVTYTIGSNVENLTLTGTTAINGTGNALDNTLIGNSAVNTLTGGAGNDILDGGVGADILAGGAGDDTYVVDNASDVITENANDGIDTVQSSVTYTLASNVENLTLTGVAATNATGNTLNNVLIGNGAANTLNGGAGTDTMIGGAGNDTYVVDNSNDVIIEYVNGGVDLVQSSVTYALVDNVENLTLTGTVAINGTGNDLDNVITGNSAANTLVGGVGDDTLNGGASSDTMIGGAGNDTYVIDNAGDVVIENLNEGTDLVQSSITNILGANVENLTLTGTTAINGTGNELDNILIGNSAVNILTGGAGNDTLNGAAGADTMIGGVGNDIYIVDSTGDIVTENANEGIDTVQSSVTYTLGNNIENLTLTGTTAINGTGNALDNVLIGNSAINTLTGGAGNDTLDGGAGADKLTGGTGNDLYIVDNTADVITENANEGADTVQSSVTFTLGANVENLTLTGTVAINATGNTLNNILIGNSAANTLSGGTGADTMSGGAGNDTYVIDNVGDVVIESINEGIDLVQSSVTYTLSANVENITLTGTTAINATGNLLDNVLTGNSAANTLSGGAGNDTLNGGTGADTMIGGVGNDTYVVDNAGDIVTEGASEGIDTVQSSITYTLGNNVENLTLTGTTAINGTGNTLDNILTGNSAINTLTGGAGNDTLDGGAGADKLLGGLGDDTYVVDNTGDLITENVNQGIDLVRSSVTYTLVANVENLTLTGTTAINGTGNTLNNVLVGNSAVNTLTGGAGNDTLDGAAANDSLVGGTGNDTYLFGRGYGVDTVIENDATAGNSDLALFSASISAEQLWFSHIGNNLEVSIIGTSDRMVMKDWYLGSQYRTEQFKTSNGKMLLDTRVENLVSAMAAFSPPVAGQTTLSPDYEAVLAPVISVNWQ